MGIPELKEMLTFKRKEGSVAQKIFCRKYLEPVMGYPDEHGNYIKIIGEEPNLAFMAHHDTVHNADGIQRVWEEDGKYLSDSNCLGADCTTGCWIILGMIDAGVEGVYVIHAGEECGGLGSSALVKDFPDWLEKIDACISFDRYGTDSIITHQSGMRTASEAFAESFAEALDMPELMSDTGGTYTDSYEYESHVSECTNISVGYDRQHTTYEFQDVEFPVKLLTALVCADWSKLVFERDPDVTEYEGFGNSWKRAWDFEQETEEERVYRIVHSYPRQVARMLSIYGFSADDLQEELFHNNRKAS